MNHANSGLNMEVRLKTNVFTRHFEDDSVVCCPRTGGCTIFSHAKKIIEAINFKWQKVEDIVRAVVRNTGCTPEDAAFGLKIIVMELLDQMFAELKVDGSTLDSDYTKRFFCNKSRQNTDAQDDDWSPLGDFYSKYSLPGQLHVDLTDGCNENCVHCYLPRGKAHFIDTKIALKVLSEFREAQGLTVYFSGGECMLHHDFALLLHHAKALNLNIIVMSNCTLCDNRMIEVLKAIDPQYVNVSLYSVTDSIHDTITRVPGSCGKTKAAIEALLSAGVHVRIVTPFMNENKNCASALEEYADNHAVHLVADSDIFGQLDHSCTNQEHALLPGEVEKLIRGHKALFARQCYDNVHCRGESKVCDIGDVRLNLNAQGRYYPCDGFHGLIIGNAHTETLMDVWHGKKLNQLRNLKNKDFGECAACEDRAWCKVCPMRNFNETGNMFTHASWRCEMARTYRKVFEEKKSC